MKRQKTQKGITLIALIITIIVLLILAVVAIGAVQNDGIINYAKNARDQYGLAQTKENTTLGNYLAKLNENNGNGTGGNGGSENDTGSTETRAYYTGDIVTVSGETFYVLKDSLETENTLVLLAKDNIIIDGENSVQSATNASTTEFSETIYWADSFTSDPHSLAESGTPDSSHYAALAAYNYGEKLGGTGRLMAYSEANNLVGTKYNRIIVDGNEYWLGSAPSANSVYFVCRGEGIWGYMQGDTAFYYSFGIRPVIEISKDKVTFVSENAFADCATCNSTGYVTGYRCTECGEVTNSIESEILGYSFRHPYPCSISSTKPTNEAWECDAYGCKFSEGSGTPIYSVTYEKCGHSDDGTGLPEKDEENCPDCDIAYVFENPEGGK